MRRGQYNEVKWDSIPKGTRKQIQNLINSAASADKVDEHGNWDFGAEFDTKGRGSALNWDVYGYGRDCHSRRILAVVQIRQYIKRRKNYWPEIKKSYFLLGRNEDNSVFAHPVEGRTIHAAIKNGRDVVQAVQSWIFGAEYKRIIRHGDVALIPLNRQPKGETIPSTKTVLQPEDGTASHLLKADEIRLNGNLYAYNPYLHHEPGTHPDVQADGWYKIVVGRRANFYDFAAPTID